MGKKGTTKKSKPSRSKASSTSAQEPPSKKTVGRITLQDVLQKKDRTAARDDDDRSASSNSSNSSVLPPEDEWDAQTLALKRSIESGAFDHLLDKTTADPEDESSVEEVELDDGDEVEEGEDGDDPTEEESLESGAAEEDNGSDHSSDDASDAHSEEVSESEGGHEQEKTIQLNADDEVLGSQDAHEDGSGDEAEEGDEEDVDEDTSEDDEESDNRQLHLTKQNQINSKALHVVTEELQSRKRLWPWAETFDVLSTEPLPFTKQPHGHDGTAEVVDIHDDLKREVAFYDQALAAVARAREECTTAKIPFTRPEDYFAEMVKTDDHMAKVKDRLIFETKKMEAVSQRKSNKEHKLRAKEAHSHKLAEKSKRKREHFKALDAWADSAASKRGRYHDDDEDQTMLRSMHGGGSHSPNKNRLNADKKFGYGGKRGRFKQNDRKTMNDTTSFNPRGGFTAGAKRTAHKKGGGTSTKKRPGKRARDANRSK